MRFPKPRTVRRAPLRMKLAALPLLALLAVAAFGAPVGAQMGPGDGAAAFDPEAATEAYLARPSDEDRARSDAYFEGGYWLQLWGLLYGLGVAWIFLGTGLSARLRDLAERWGRWKWLQTVLYSMPYIFLATLLSLPLAIYRDYFREHKYGLSNLTFGAWLWEGMIGLAVSLVLGSLGLVLLYAVLRRAKRTWWIWGAAVAVVFFAFTALIAPVFIMPLFNTYTPLEDPEIREPILAMAQANGIASGDVWVSDASKQTKRISANVSGIFGTERITLNDNLLNRTSLAEIEHVMGHEIGHYALNHVYEALIEIGLLLLVAFAFLAWSFERVRRRWGESWGVRDVGDLAGLPLLLALLSVFFFLTTPVFNTIIRVNEQEADLYALNAARQPDAAAEVALKLSEYRKLDPSPLEEWLFYTHPSGRTRILTAMRWKAANLPEPEPASGEPTPAPSEPADATAGPAAGSDEAAGGAVDSGGAG